MTIQNTFCPINFKPIYLMTTLKHIILVYGLPGSGKTTLSDEIARQMPSHSVGRLNADKVRSTLSSDLGFKLEDRVEQSRRMACLSSILLDGTSITTVVTDFVNPNLETAACFLANTKLPIGNKVTDQDRIPNEFRASTNYPVYSVLMRTIPTSTSRFTDTNQIWAPEYADYEITSYLDERGFKEHATAIRLNARARFES